MRVSDFRVCFRYLGAGYMDPHWRNWYSKERESYPFAHRADHWVLLS